MDGKIDTVREAFEKWAVSKGYSIIGSPIYSDYDTRKNWQGWEAAISTIDPEVRSETIDQDYSTPGPWRLEGDEVVGRDGYRILKMIAWEDAGKCLEGQHNLKRILAASSVEPAQGKCLLCAHWDTTRSKCAESNVMSTPDGSWYSCNEHSHFEPAQDDEEFGPVNLNDVEPDRLKPAQDDGKPDVKSIGGANTLDELIGLMKIARDNKTGITLDWVEVGIIMRATEARVELAKKIVEWPEPGLFSSPYEGEAKMYWEIVDYCEAILADEPNEREASLPPWYNPDDPCESCAREHGARACLDCETVEGQVDSEWIPKEREAESMIEALVWKNGEWRIEAASREAYKIDPRESFVLVPVMRRAEVERKIKEAKR